MTLRAIASLLFVGLGFGYTGLGQSAHQPPKSSEQRAMPQQHPANPQQPAKPQQQTPVETSTTLLPKESLQLSPTLDRELEQLLQRWYEGYERRNAAPLALAGAVPVPNVPDSVYLHMMSRIPSGIRLSYNSVVRESIELYLFRRRPLLSSMMSLADLYFPDIEAELDRQGLPLELKYLTIVESALNPQAISPAGAGGLWQFMLPTARIYGLTINSLVDERMDPQKGTEAACRMLKELYHIYKDWWLVMAAYNCGPGNVNRALARAGGSARSFWEIYPHLPRETRKYVPLFIGVYFAMHYAEHYGIKPRELGRTLATEFYEVNQSLSFAKIASLTGISEEQIKAFNPQFRRGIIPGNIEPYQIRLPLKAVLKLEGYKPEEIRSHELSVVEEDIASRAGGRLLANSDKYIYHRVARGETVDKVARRYGVTAREIRTWNTIGRRGLRRGQRIIVGVKPEATASKDSIPAEPSTAAEVATESGTPKIPQESQPSAHTDKSSSKPKADKETQPRNSPKTYKVKKGDTLGAIARRHGITLKDLRSWNNIQNDRIQIGQVLKVSK